MECTKMSQVRANGAPHQAQSDGPIQPPRDMQAMAGESASTLPPSAGDSQSFMGDVASEHESETKGKPFVSKGWKVHNEITYRGIDWILNSTVGVLSAYWMGRTEHGKRHFQEPVSGFFKKALKPFMQSEAAVAEGAKWGTKFAAIMAGGFTIIPLMMFMENKKVKKSTVHWLDEKIYGKDAVANDPKFAQAYKNIDEEPEKGFWIGIASRIVAITPLITVASIPATNKPLIKYLYDPIGHASKWISQKIGIKPGAMALKGELEHLDGDPKSVKQFQSNWDYLHRTIGFDFGLTIFYAILHEAAFKGLAALGVKKEKTPKNASKTAAQTAAAQPEPSTATPKAEPMAAPAADAIPTPQPAQTGRDTPLEQQAEAEAALQHWQNRTAQAVQGKAPKATGGTPASNAPETQPRALKEHAPQPTENYGHFVQQTREAAATAPQMG